MMATICHIAQQWDTGLIILGWHDHCAMGYTPPEARSPPIALGNVSGSGLARAIKAGSPNSRRMGVPIELPPKPNSPEQKPMPTPTNISKNQGSEVILNRT
ncbi:hypothetical protein H6G81_14820 [Scytonema hofmannii FACHB-248]|uniref:Uncharacterized protein n=1 Tax=Scytonema hofmannii FACHB-248 TaxID=1842502 RepID=A0ABR8GRE2_9CYAN|nr:MULTISPECIES: hypothetical protein [Nostocales]MBD2605759.1 hypothetical protein [Scytonema hofmannii FACHB-248]